MPSLPVTMSVDVFLPRKTLLDLMVINITMKLSNLTHLSMLLGANLTFLAQISQKSQYCNHPCSIWHLFSPLQDRRNRGAGGHCQFLADQLFLSQPRAGHIMPTSLPRAPLPPRFSDLPTALTYIMARGNERTIQKMAADNECHYSSGSISDPRYIVMLYTHHYYLVSLLCSDFCVENVHSFVIVLLFFLSFFMFAYENLKTDYLLMDFLLVRVIRQSAVIWVVINKH